MKKALKIIVLILAAVFIAAQFYRPDRTITPIVQAETLAATTAVPENVAAILKRSCNDCHTNETVYPWYSNVALVSWAVARHIDEGRRELNFSVWNTYSQKKKGHKLDEICDQVIGSEMPHFQYLWIHGDAKLSDADKRTLCEWARAERAKINGS